MTFRWVCFMFRSFCLLLALRSWQLYRLHFSVNFRVPTVRGTSVETLLSRVLGIGKRSLEYFYIAAGAWTAEYSVLLLQSPGTTVLGVVSLRN